MKVCSPADSSGFSLPELLVGMAVLTLLITSVLLFTNPIEQRKKARDTKRIADMTVLASSIERYIADHGGTPPDVSGPIRTSLDAKVGSIPQKSDGTGWINTDLSVYSEKLPTDPINTPSSVYRYRRVGTQYELDAPLEILLEVAHNSYDGGTNDARYEVGTNLTLLE